MAAANCFKKEVKMKLTKNSISEIEAKLKNIKMLAMLAPSFAGEFDYPAIINQLKELGFDKIVELTFGAKMINRDYHKKLEDSKELIISSVCPGIVSVIKEKYPQYKKNLIQVDSPMIATAKICRKFYPKYKIAFISPCNFKKQEAESSKYVDYVIDYVQLRQLFEKYNIKPADKKAIFDKFYNDYTKIYPLSGGLTKTAHIKKIFNKQHSKVIDGIKDVTKFLDNPDKKIKFLDVTFCKGGCIGGPCTNQNITIKQKKKKLIHYMNIAKKEDIPKPREGLIKRAKGIKFERNL